MEVCGELGCGKKLCARGFCVACYYRKLRRGELTSGTQTKRWKHRLSSVDKEAKTAICAECGPVRIAARGRSSNGSDRWRCLVDANGRAKLYKAAYRQIKKNQLKDHCEICFTKDKLCWDHNHATGLFRGTLCSQCNTAIGLLKDDPIICQQAASYLQRTTQLDK